MPALVAMIAGLVRGITGFGGAMVMAPPLVLLLGPKFAVPIVMLLESIAAAPQLVQTRRLVRWRVVGPILAASFVTIPIGGYLLLTADPLSLRRATALIVIVFSLLLLRGWRYSGAHRTSTGLALGGLSGALLGATSIGGPPVILYLLAGPDRVEVTRANLSLFVGVVSAAGALMLFAAGALDATIVWTCALLAPGYYGGLVAGTRLFSRFNDDRFRQFTLLLMILVSAGILIA
ncbi:MAG: sulfite exporter TauE/SafE family protein [Burkholderiales bacterium]